MVGIYLKYRRPGKNKEFCAGYFISEDVLKQFTWNVLFFYSIMICVFNLYF